MKTQDVYAVVWTKEAAKNYGVFDQIIVTVEPKEDIKVRYIKGKIGRPKIRYADALAIFSDKKEAEAFRAGNKDWFTVKLTLIIPLSPTPNK